MFGLNTISKSFIQKATWKSGVFFTALFAIFYMLINYSGVGVAGLLKITGGANILDFAFGYNRDKAYQLLSALGADGRMFYLTKIVPLDFPFPFAYMLCYAGWIALLIKDTARPDWCKYLLLLPVVAMLFDWTENVGVVAMLNGYPDLPAWAVLLSSIAGMLKFVFTAGNIIVIGFLFILFLAKRKRG